MSDAAMRKKHAARNNQVSDVVEAVFGQNKPLRPYGNVTRLNPGDKFNRLTVIRENGRKWAQVAWLCYCECGKIITVASQSLRYGTTKSCGCLKQELIHQLNYKHGGSARKDPEYSVWVTKCTRRHPRGVKICSRWKKSYKNFLKDVGRRPTPQHVLARLDVDGHWEPKNVRWMTKTENNRNASNSIVLTLNGVTKSLREWCITTGLKYVTVYERLRRGYSVEEALKNK